MQCTCIVIVMYICCSCDHIVNILLFCVLNRVFGPGRE